MIREIQQHETMTFLSLFHYLKNFIKIPHILLNILCLGLKVKFYIKLNEKSKRIKEKHY